MVETTAPAAAVTQAPPDTGFPLRQRRALVAIATAQLLALTLWFSASAVAPQLESIWGLSGTQSAGLTLAVQIGFVLGALGLAVSGLPDRVNSRRLFTSSAVIGLTANGALVLLETGHFPAALTLRFVTGAALAGIYPSGLKVMAGWFRSGRGTALGVLVGALTVGSAGPHLIRGVGLDWRGVVLGASVLAGAAALVMQRVEDGPYEVGATRFSWRHLGTILRNRGVRLSTYGYGFAVVADSAQFSTMVTETAGDAERGTALTLQTAIGFLLTLVTIQLVQFLAGCLTWRWAFPVLAAGPALGIAAMVALRRSPAAARLAGGRR